MNANAKRCLAAVVTAAAMGAAAADTSPPADCQVPPSESPLLVDRDGALSRYEQLPQHCLKAMFMQCAAQAGRQLLDLGSAAVCSVGYEALLRRGFSGDFQALLAWWRTQRPGEHAAN